MREIHVGFSMEGVRQEMKKTLQRENRARFALQEIGGKS